MDGVWPGLVVIEMVEKGKKNRAAGDMHTGTGTVGGCFHPECFLFLQMLIYTGYIGTESLTTELNRFTY